MTAELLGRLSARTILVVGKGGVGKTTTAGALALACADGGQRTHLISTDPAHSVGDVFREDAGPDPAVSRCSDLLTLEAFDGQARARAWIASAGVPLAELVERGTYLDDDDVASFLRLALPGVDEVMAALRLVELDGGVAERVVVDTAPTGHTLRLVASGELIEGWIAAFRAMADKAGTVAEALLRRRVRFAAEQVLDELESHVGAFEALVGAADVVIVTRPESVVAAETARLRSRLEELGARIAATVSVGGADPRQADALAIPLGADPTGCAGLRAWGAGGAAASTAAPAGTGAVGPAGAGARAPARGHGAETIAALLRRELLFFAGKGGVGKSTCAAAAAVTVAADRPVVLVSVDPAGSLSEVLGAEVGGAWSPVAPGLQARQVDAVAEFEAFRRRYRDRIEEVFRAVGVDDAAALDRRVVQSLWDLAPPGLDEIFALVALMEDAPVGGTLVVDAAPTGHFLRLLEMPGLALDWTHALLRLLAKYGALLRLDDVAGPVLGFAKQLKNLKLKLSDPARCATVVVTLPGAVVAAETARLEAALDRAGFPVGALLVNRAVHDGAGQAHRDRPVLAAPRLAEPPRGVRALAGFLSQWERVA
jgi:arsenite/tail-anchored protein-transporting ATPase